MKAREPRPQATPLSLYFFSHLAEPASEESAGRQVAVPAPALPPATGAAAVDGVLWGAFTPESFKTKAAALLAEERARTAALDAELAAAWERVEAIIARNQARRALLSSAALDEDVRSVEETPFWTSEEITTRFQLETTVGGAQEVADGRASPSAAAAAAAARVTLHFSVLASRPLADPLAGGEADAAVDDSDSAIDPAGDEGAPALGTHHTRAYTAATEDLLDPCRRPHPLRRLFAPTLRRRDTLPKGLTKLLAEVQAVQSGELSALEAALDTVGAVFRVPLYVPFRSIADVLTRVVCQPTNTDTLEASAVERLRAVEPLTQERHRYVTEAVADRQALAALPFDRRVAASEGMWQRLFHELFARRALHSAALEDYSALTSTAEQSHAGLVAALDACEADSQAAMAQLLRDADDCTAAVARSQARTRAIVEEMNAAYTANAERLQASVARKAYALAKSEAAQERLARRVREAVRELRAEQLTYEESAQELLRERLSLAQLEASYQQLRKAFAARHEQSERLSSDSTTLHKMLQQAEVSRQHLLAACRRHADRAHYDDGYRRCRVMAKVVDNAQAWSRCVRDVGALYEERFVALESKSRASWQLNYLAAGERDWAAGNLLEVRPEMAEVAAQWSALRAMAEPLDLDVSASVAATGGDEEGERLAQMVCLDGPPAVQRKVTTLAQYRTRAAAGDVPPPTQSAAPVKKKSTAGSTTGSGTADSVPAAAAGVADGRM